MPTRCQIVLETSAFEDFGSVQTMLRDVTQEIIRYEYFDSNTSNDLEKANETKHDLIKK